jgi:hypothetical protein
MSFPTQVNVQPAIAVEGDFASTNTNKFSTIAGVGAFIAGTAGLTVGGFCWQDPVNPANLNSFGAGPVLGFVAREGLRADIITPGPGYPQASMTILGGSFITAFDAGDFFVRNSGATTATSGMKAYANFQNGTVSFAAAGSPPVAAALTTIAIVANVLNASTVAPNAFTGSIAGNILTVSAVGTGGLFSGQTIAGTGVDPNTTVGTQLTGTAGAAGTYNVSISQTVASTAMTGSGGWLTVTSMTSGVVYPGQTWSGGSNAFAAGTTILPGGTGTGGAGTYPVSISQTLASTATATGSGGVLTLTTLGSGSVKPGDTLSTTSSTGSPYFLPFGTGGTTGVGIGGGTTYVISNATGAGDTAGSVYGGVETKWYVAPGNFGGAAPNEIVAITSTPPG